MSWPNQLVPCEAQMRFGSAGEPFRWYISQPPKCGPLTSHRVRVPSDVRMKAPLRVPTSTRTPLMPSSFLLSLSCRPGRHEIDNPVEPAQATAIVDDRRQ